MTGLDQVNKYFQTYCNEPSVVLVSYQILFCINLHDVLSCCANQPTKTATCKGKFTVERLGCIAIVITLVWFFYTWLFGVILIHVLSYCVNLRL